MSTPQLVAELRRVADALGSDTLTQPQFNAHSSLSASAVSRRLGSWKAALHAAGLKPVVMGRRYSEEDFFENLLAVWTHYGRQPKYREMDQPPSKITAGGYECRFGGWTKALIAFVEYANANSSVEVEDPAARPPANDAPSNGPAVVTRSQRSIPLGLRYDVLRRDNFKCVICGRSPATDPKCTLHVDHIVPVSKDGTAASDNLRTLCADCNLGKSAKLEAVQQWLPADAASRRS